MNLFVRADSSPAVGAGHVMRCLALGQACVDRGGSVAFATPEADSPIFARLREQPAIEIVSLPREPEMEADAEATAFAARARHADFVVLDGYGFGHRYRRRIKSAGLRLLVLDDLDLVEPRDADVVLNQNLHATATMNEPAAGTPRMLRGPRYALLRREFTAWRDRRREIRARATRLLVTLGGGDVGDAVAKTLSSIVALGRPELSVRCLVGPLGRATPEITRLAQEAECEITLETAADEMPELMAWADVGLSGGGSTCWELLFMGLPALLIAHNAHQERIAHSVGEAGAALYAGTARGVAPRELTALLAQLLDDAGRRRRLSRSGRQLVDGRGAERVILALEERLDEGGR